MPMMTSGGKVRKSELPSTIQRSDAKAQRTFAEAHDSATKEYGTGQRAFRVAYGALKHTHEKVGDHWQPKAGGRKGPSDPQSKGGRNTHRTSAGGVDMEAPKQHLYEVAKRLDVPGRSSMTKMQLVKAIEKANNRDTRKARGRA
ncbi:ChaB family protein [Actinomadura atramentaria]|uniref:ChaB family protein n=1 Tax=Actinomadura atramentaria TaxID=1990 RepID=UPI000381DC90|nr:ChaB family protein [Actinomadura atramentaria]